MNKREIKKFLGMTTAEFKEFESSVGVIQGRYCNFESGRVYPNTTKESIVSIQNPRRWYNVRYFLASGAEVFKDYFSPIGINIFLRRDNCIVLNSLDNRWSTSYDDQKIYMTENEYREKVAIDNATGRNCLKQDLVEVDGVMINRLHINGLTNRSPYNEYVLKTSDGQFHLVRNYVKVVSDYPEDLYASSALTEFFTQSELDELVSNGDILLCEDGAYERKEYVKHYEDKIYSSGYFYQHYKKCARCGNYHLKDELIPVITANNYSQLWCASCVRELAITYNGKFYERSAMVEIDGIVYTNSILSREIYGYHQWTRSGHTYTPHALEDENTEMYFGTEVETQSENDANYAYVLHGKCSDLFHCERDGSIGHGAEIISQTLSLGLIKSRAEDIREMFANLYSHGVKGHNATNACCGFHVHVSRKAFKDENAIKKANAIINNFQTECEKLARRKSDRYYSYNPITGVITKEKVQMPSGHSYAVNNQNPNTIEFRIFRSTLNLETYIGTIEFVKNVVDMANSDKVRIKFSDLLKGEYLPLYVEDLNQRRMNQNLAPINGDVVIDFTGFYQNDLKNVLLEKKNIKQSFIDARKHLEEFNRQYPQYRLEGAY